MKKLIYFTIFCSVLISCKDNKKKETTDNIPLEIMEDKSPELKVIPILHAATVLEWGEKTIYIDPYGGAEGFDDQKSPDLILITDIHGDHMDVNTLDSLAISNVKIIAPQAVADQLPEIYKAQTEILNNGDFKDVMGINIEAIPMYNLREEALKFHEKGRGNGYVLTLGDKRVYFSGDTEDIPEMRALKNIDKAFICMNLPYTMTEESAASAVLEFKPKQVYPYHYRGKPDVSDVVKFKNLVNEGNREIEVIQLDWYPNIDY
ncbi:MBL fold metallo-hydrolase [Cellulophaga sp. HaHaR_3_176]|uniref:MBL fold metallo-hydrolase n=1 Tax=Cellulophaga sp. HaHaR_3_176 TaxID=1942464 RepID=UPI001C1F60A6|nr:MBL fold metallo-hydrolase [Cellulophaga sp. HaHaR_3_176]QWX85454.1 MBL fold metallo-hydrolase [Cellulophaga sp. HaHaR_3_176]